MNEDKNDMKTKMDENKEEMKIIIDEMEIRWMKIKKKYKNP
jgi:hypothetical protein